jgi:hypothetical protein
MTVPFPTSLCNAADFLIGLDALDYGLMVLGKLADFADLVQELSFFVGNDFDFLHGGPPKHKILRADAGALTRLVYASQHRRSQEFDFVGK